MNFQIIVENNTGIKTLKLIKGENDQTIRRQTLLYDMCLQ